MTKKQNILLSHLINKYLSGYGNIQFIKSQRWIKFTRSHKGSDVYVEKSLFFFFILKYKLSRSTKFFGKCFQWKIHFLFPFIFTHFLNETSISYMSNPKKLKNFSLEDLKTRIFLKILIYFSIGAYTRKNSILVE